MENKEFLLPVRVYVEDTDAGGVVYYVNYLKFMERARTEFLRRHGIPKAALLTDDLMLVVASAHIDYKRSARLDDLLFVTAAPIKKARSYIEFQQRVLRSVDVDGQEKELIAEGNVTVVCVSKHTMRPSVFPEFLVTALAELEE